VVSSGRPNLSVLLLTEDSGGDAFATFQRVAKELLKQVDAYVNTQPQRLTFEPVREKEALQALHANIWKSDKARDRQKQVALIGTLATQLMLENGWALFHFDGDRTWSDRASSENVKKFQDLVREKVRLRIVMELEKRQAQASKPVVPHELEARANQRMTRLKQVVPFYSMESWLFQNTREAIRLCGEHYQGRDAERFQEWEKDRTALDEVLQPKKATCLGAKHNLELASQGFPAREAHAAGKSFAAAVQELAQDENLTAALRRTYTYE
jgi:septum formation topological specificity factor MinE